jgi:hypothetical protein
MRYAAVFALIALAPAAVNAQVPAFRMLSVALCSGGIVAIPAGPARHNDDSHCAKACHAGCTRKRILRLV